VNNTSQIILNILIKILGAPKKESINLKEYEFNCKSKICRHDEKYNLAYNSKNNIFHCWKCKYSGTAHRIAEDYGNKDDLERISSVLPKKNYIKNNQKTKEYNELIVCQLPEGFNPLTKKSDSKYYKSAVMYITGKKKGQRALSWDLIKKYNIGYTENKGNRKYRIIFPSYNEYGQVNYYVGRSYYDFIKPNYMGPPKEEVARTEIIFNSKNINFDLPIILVEGVFDMIHLYNAIPMLGKVPSEFIVKKLKEHKSRVILCLDEDALYDSISLYNELTSYGLDVYFVEIKDDIDEFVKKNGKNATVELLRTCRKIDFQYMFQKLALKEKGKKSHYVDEKKLKEDWEQMKKEILKDQNG
jgi:hypothetical protein